MHIFFYLLYWNINKGVRRLRIPDLSFFKYFPINIISTREIIYELDDFNRTDSYLARNIRHHI
jgi:hypothetical protein